MFRGNLVGHHDGFVHRGDHESHRMARNGPGCDLFPLQPLQLAADKLHHVLRQLGRCGDEIDLRIFVMLRFAKKIGRDMGRFGVAIGDDE